ncbi:MAG: zf-HC2 domain-containing protein [Candidatus Sabulitectum sp.]|nr:zf-HC2 domain-containing protein [Candidatus Sabulitectum sp.]
MKCNEALILMDLVIDSRATHEEEQLLRFHLNGCSSCRKTMQLNRSISKKIKELEEVDPPDDVMDKIQARLASGNYDRSPMGESGRFRFPVWRIAAVIPFAAALVFFLQNFTGENSTENVNSTAVLETAGTTIQETALVYAPAPVVAYSRPSSVSTF